MANEQEVISIVSSVVMARVQVEDTAKMSFEDQLKLLRNTNILVGIHGAGLMYIMFAAEEAILIEIHPSYRQDRHFRHAARMTNKVSISSLHLSCPIDLYAYPSHTTRDMPRVLRQCDGADRGVQKNIRWSCQDCSILR